MRHLMIHALYWGNGSQGPITDSIHVIGHGIGAFFHGIGKIACSVKYDDIKGIVASGKNCK